MGYSARTEDSPHLMSYSNCFSYDSIVRLCASPCNDYSHSCRFRSTVLYDRRPHGVNGFVCGNTTHICIALVFVAFV